MQTPIISIVFFLIASFLGAIGQYLYKSGAEIAGGSVSSYLLNPRLLADVGCYIGVMILFVAAFKKGGSLTILHPIYATTFIWAALLAFFVFGTAIKPVNIAGMLLLVSGMYLMGK
ncbi:MAG: drug/metabolite transporter (DMT)-like permease [Saprospiraceae bacterium]|jgi:drug/metabolite transporter (DMT)-like permease